MIYIDCGCHNAESIKDFYKIRLTEGISSIGIDPLKKYLKEWEGVTKRYGTKFINEAVLDFTGEVDYSEKVQDIKSSVMKSKQGFSEGNIYKVKCFDFSEFIKNLNDEVIIRMDIEGAEYPVLEKMIKDKTIQRINFIEVEWHATKMTGGKFAESQRIIHRALNEYKIKYFDCLT